jgi:glycosyltransferase involved in cell wall biosynthesis
MNEKPKLIGIDARFYGEAGPGRYAKAIIDHLEKIDDKNGYKIFLRKQGYESYKPKNAHFTKVLADFKWYSWEEQVGFLLLLLRANLDLLYVPHFNIPILYPRKMVTAIPDIIMHTYSTEKGTTLPKPYFRFKKLIYKFVVYWAVFRSEKVIVPSQDTLTDFLKTFPSITKDKYVLAYEGVDPDVIRRSENSDAILQKYGIAKPFLLYVSSMYEHKNIFRLIEAFKLLITKYEFTGQLVLIGKNDKFSQNVFQVVADAGLDGKILLPGLKSYVSDADIAALREHALAYVFPSLKEGFSLTPLEAQAAGLPCVISDIPCHREIYKDTVLYFNPLDIEDMAMEIDLLVKDPNLREALRVKGLNYYKNFDWLDTARLTLNVFNLI